jgi:hypothetical protein
LAVTFGLNEATKRVFDGVSHLRNWAMPASAPITLGLLGDGGVEWEVELPIRGGELAAFPSETLRKDGVTILQRAFGSEEIEAGGDRYALRKGLIPSLAEHAIEWFGRSDPEDPESRSEASLRKHLSTEMPDWLASATTRAVIPLAVLTVTNSYRTYHYEINHLLRFGSVHSSELRLMTTGENVFPLLRNWRDQPELEERYDFVLNTMREIFPHLNRFGFEQAGQTVTMSVTDHRWSNVKSIPISRESTGFITALLQLCAVASCPRNGLVTLDEIETSLHPRAIRVLIEACRRRAASHDLRIVLATQSETVLDQFRDDPARVFVLEPRQERSPLSLTELFSPEYLSQFSLGDLFAHLEFGGDDPVDPE